jgi:hypothetical protein
MHKFVLPLVLASVLIVPVTAGAQERTGASSVDRHPQPRAPKTPEEVMARLSTAERAKKLREADAQTREAFGKYQSVVAEARRDSDPTDADADALLAVQAQSATRAQISHFGEDSDERAQQLRNVGRATQKAFDKFQALLWREQDLAEAAGAEARVAAFGPEPAAPAPTGQPDSATAHVEDQDAGDQNH